MEQKYEVTVNKRGEFWRQNGKLHRLDGPACIYPCGTQKWYQNGLYHRVDGPAVIYPDGHRAWYQNGEFHRDDGPAIVYNDGAREWYINGEELTEDEFNARNAPCAGREVVVDGITYCLTPK